jgi:hypothetical protein
MILHFPTVDAAKIYLLGGEPFLYISTIVFDTGRISANLTPLKSEKNLIIPWEAFVGITQAPVIIKTREIPFEWYEKIQDSLDGEVQKMSNVELLGEYLWYGNIASERASRVEKLGF